MRVKVSTYADLDRWVKLFVAKKDPIPLLIIVGPPGTAKSTRIREAIGEDVAWFTGNVTPFRLYCEAYKHMNMPLVIDDIDDILVNPNAVRLMKALCETRTPKRVGWHTAAKQLHNENIPTSFLTESRVAVIANECGHEKDKNLQALENRGVWLDFSPTAKELHEQMKKAKWFRDEDVMKFFGQHLQHIGRPSMRDYEHASKLRANKFDWERLMLESWGWDEADLCLRDVLADKKLNTSEKKAKKWTQLTGMNRATYFERRKKLFGVNDVKTARQSDEQS